MITILVSNHFQYILDFNCPLVFEYLDTSSSFFIFYPCKLTLTQKNYFENISIVFFCLKNLEETLLYRDNMSRGRVLMTRMASRLPTHLLESPVQHDESPPAQLPQLSPLYFSFLSLRCSLMSHHRHNLLSSAPTTSAC